VPLAAVVLAIAVLGAVEHASSTVDPHQAPADAALGSIEAYAAAKIRSAHPDAPVIGSACTFNRYQVHSVLQDTWIFDCSITRTVSGVSHGISRQVVCDDSPPYDAGNSASTQCTIGNPGTIN
jgi:hypothetical protein